MMFHGGSFGILWDVSRRDFYILWFIVSRETLYCVGYIYNYKMFHVKQIKRTSIYNIHYFIGIVYNLSSPDMLLIQSYYIISYCKDSSLCTIGYVYFFKDIWNMIFDGSFTYIKIYSNFFIEHSTSDLLKDFYFTSC